MVASVIDGKQAAQELKNDVAAKVAARKSAGKSVPGLRVIIVGDDPASRVYVGSKAKTAAKLGLDAALIEHPADIDTGTLLAEIDALNRDPTVHGILVQLPLPPQIDEQQVLLAIDPAKDVDGFHPINVGALNSRKKGVPTDLLLPCTPAGCLQLVRRVMDPAGKTAVVIGRSNIVGKPMAALLTLADATVTIAHSRTPDLPGLCRTADILVAAIGRPEMVTPDFVKPGATVIDVGINRITGEDGTSRLVGDVAYQPVMEIAGAVTPVPGGVGPMTIANLMANTLLAAELADGGV